MQIEIIEGRQREQRKLRICAYCRVSTDEDHFEWLLNLNPDTCGELDDAGSPVYFKTITITPDDERAWFKTHPQWSKSNKYAELEARIYI